MKPNESRMAIRNLAIGAGFGFILLFLVAWLTPASWTHDNHIVLAFILMCVLTLPFGKWILKLDRKKAEKEGGKFDGGLGIGGNWMWLAFGAGGFIIMSHVMYLIENFA